MIDIAVRVLIHLGLILGTSLALVYLYFRRRYAYWGERGVPHDKPRFLLGSLGKATAKNFGVVVRDLYEASKAERVYGIWFIHRPTLLINDLDLVRDVLVKDFNSFQDHGVYHNESVDPLSANLFAIEGSKWRKIRVKLTPTFTSGKMRMMFPIVRDCTKELCRVIEHNSDDVVEVKDLIARYTTDVIASCAFGIEANSLKNPDNTFRVMGRKLFESSWEMYLRNMWAFLVPEMARLIKMRLVPKKLSDFFVGVIRDTMTYRTENNIKRNDFLQLLMQLMDKGYVEDVDEKDLGEKEEEADKQKFTFEEAVPEAFIFFVGGFETSSTTMQFILYELALNPEIQDRLRAEILDGLAGGEMTYEKIHGMEYMGRVIEETLRKHPPATILMRICTKPYKIPGTSLTLEKGTSVMIPTYGFQMDEANFPDPTRFDPDRFLESEKSARNHYAYLPFGDGPRICIGQRFAIMQMRAALTAILSRFRVEVAEGRTLIPMVYDPKNLVLSPKGGMHLRIVPL